MESRQYEQDRYNQMKIYIPTFRRVDNQITFNTLPDKIKQNVIMVVQEQEREQYKYDCEYLIVDNNIGIAKTRELIYHHAGTNYFGVLDDDITFYLRNSKYFKNEKSNMEMSKRVMTYEDWNNWFLEINNQFNKSDIMHIGHRDTSIPPMNIRYLENKLFIGAHWIDGNKLTKFIDDVDWNYVQVGEDSMLTLECCMRGYRCLTSCEVVMERWKTAFDKGGCSEFRTAKLNEEEHIKLVKKYPFVYLTNKYYDIKNMGRMRKFSTDVKGAYKSSEFKGTLKEFL